MAADTCELCATRQKVKASAICFVLPSRLPLELGGEGSADFIDWGNLHCLSAYHSATKLLLGRHVTHVMCVFFLVSTGSAAMDGVPAVAMKADIKPQQQVSG